MPKPADEGTGLPLLDHLEELRRRILYGLAALLVCAIGAWFVSGPVLDLLTRPVERLVFLSPPEAFVTRLKAALVTGAFIAGPFLFYHFWRFVRPALLPGESRYVLLAVLFSTLFLAGGVLFGFFVVLPIGVRFFLGFEGPRLEAMISIGRYVGFAAQILLATGLIFQLPVAIFFLTKLGIVTPRSLRRNRRHAIIGVFILAAVLTPPDVFTQLLLAGPMIVLFELSILGSVIAARTRRPQVP